MKQEERTAIERRIKTIDALISDIKQLRDLEDTRMKRTPKSREKSRKKKDFLCTCLKSAYQTLDRAKSSLEVALKVDSGEIK